MSEFDEFLNRLLNEVMGKEDATEIHTKMHGVDHYKAANELLYDAETSYNAARKTGEISDFMVALDINLELVKAHSLQAQSFAALEGAAAVVEASQKREHTHHAKIVKESCNTIVTLLGDMQKEPAKVLEQMHNDSKTSDIMYDGSYPYKEAMIRATIEYIKLNISEAAEIFGKRNDLADPRDGGVVEYVAVTPDMSPEDVSRIVEEKVSRIREQQNEPHPHATVDDAKNIVDAMQNPPNTDLIDDDENESRDL